MTANLVVENLYIAHKGAALINDVSLEIVPGQMSALIGPSGAGKSLSAKAAAGLYHPSFQISGTLPKEEKVAYLPQDPGSALDPIRTVAWHLEHANLSGTPLDKEKITSLLARVGLHHPAETLHKFPHQLSGGMARRVTIAQCLLNETPFFIIDEPTNGIEGTGITDLMRTFQELSTKGHGILLITHNIPLALKWCQRGTLMHKGRTLERLEGEDWKNGAFQSPTGISLMHACRKFMGDPS